MDNLNKTKLQNRANELVKYGYSIEYSEAILYTQKSTWNISIKEIQIALKMAKYSNLHYRITQRGKEIR